MSQLGAGYRLTTQSLAAPIQAEKDRAQAGGATIESGVYTDLIQPIYEVLDGAGEWGNVVFLGTGGVRTVTSGSVEQLWDQSGNNNDANQGTSSARPTDATDANSGHAAPDFDGSDDGLAFSGGNISDEKFTLIHVLSDVDTANGPYQVVDLDDGSGDLVYNIIETDKASFTSNGDDYFGFLRENNKDESHHAKRSSYPVAVTFEHDNDYQIYENKTALSMTFKLDKIDVFSGGPLTTLGNRNSSSRFLDGKILSTIAIDSKLATSVRESLVDVLINYYSL